MAVTRLRINASTRLSPSADHHEALSPDQTGLLKNEVEKQIAWLHRDLEKQLGIRKEADARAYSSVIDSAGGQLPFEFDSASISLRLESCGVYISSYQEFVLVILRTESNTISLSRILSLLQENNLKILQLKSRAISDRSFLTSIHAQVDERTMGFSYESLHEKLVQMGR